jgi:hypothetical protein
MLMHIALTVVMRWVKKFSCGWNCIIVQSSLEMVLNSIVVFLEPFEVVERKAHVAY